MSSIPPPLILMRVLHIDDSPDDREILKQTLEGFYSEMEVFSAAAPSESIRMMEELQIDCIISDYSMPEMDGLELCRKIRDFSDVPFIIYTGKGSEEVASVAFEAGASDYIRKEPGPGHYRVLANRVRQAVEKHWGDGLYRNVLENTKDGIIIARGTRIVYANQAIADLVGVSRAEELHEMDSLDFIMEKDRGRVQSIALGRQRGEPQPPQFEIEYQRSDGEPRKLEISSSLIQYEGRPASLSVVRDVSETVRVRERLAALHNCTHRLASAESIEEIAKLTLDSIEEVFDFRWGDISIIEEGRFIPVYFKGATYVDFEALSIDGPGIVARAARTGESQLVHDTRVDDDYLPTYIDDDTTTLSELAVPFKENGSVIGVLNLESPSLDGFSVDDQRLLEIFSQYVASAVIRIRNDDLLKASEEKYRNILESSMDGITVTRDSKIIFANQRFVEMLGFEDQLELQGRSTLEFFAPEFKTLINERRNKRREGDNSTFQYDMHFLGRDGKPFYVESRTSPIDFEGEPAFLGIHRDTNERKRFDTELRDSEERWRSLVALAPDGIITFNQLGFVTSINDVFVELTGFSKNEIVGKHFTKLGTLRARDMPKYVKLFSSLVRGQTPPPLDFEYQRKDGSMGWGQAHMRSIRVGDKSREILMILRETSELKRIEEELRESEERHRTLVELSPQGIMVIDREGYVRSANPAVEKLHGFTPKEIVGKHFTELPHFKKDDLPKYQEGFKSIMDGNIQQNYEYSLNHKDGSNRWATVNVNPLKNLQGEIDGFLAVLNDVTEQKLMEEALRVNQERFHAFMESAPVTLTIYDSGLNYVDANQNLLDLYGYTREFLIGRNMEDLHPDTIETGRSKLYRKVIQTGEPLFLPEVRSPNKLGDRVFSIWAFKVGEGMRLISTEITENKNYEYKLRESEEKYRGLFDLSPYAIVISDMKGRITDVNDAVTQMSGYAKNELIGKHISKLPMITKSEIPRYLKIFSSFMSGTQQEPMEIPVRTKDGTKGIIEMHVGFIERAGEKTGIQAVFKNVTLQKEAEEELRRSEGRYRSLIELAPDGVMTLNLKGEVTSVNTAYLQLTGYSENELLGKHFTKLGTAVSLKDMPKYVKMFAAMLRGKPAPIVEFDFKRKDGTIGRGEARSQVVEVEPGKREVLTVHRDITESKRLDEQLREYTRNLEGLVEERTQELVDAEHLVAVGKVSAMVGHDLRGPLVVVRNAVDLARKDPEKIDRMLDMIDRNAGHAIGILEELRTSTRDEPVALATVEIGHFLNRILEDTILPPGVEFRQEIDEDLPKIILDEAKTMRAMQNLIENAKDAMPGGGIITISARRESDHVVFSVSDTGVGIADEVHENIFKPFYTTKPKGLGLGLPSTRRMIEVQGGSISIESNEDKGSKFSIRLPLKEPQT